MASTPSSVGYTPGAGTSIAGAVQGGDLYQSVIMHGEQDDTSLAPLSMTPEGHAEVAIHSPTLPFGSVHTEALSVEFQADFVYGVSATQSIQTTSGTGAITSANSIGKVATGTTALSFASVQSRKRLRYRPGQGVVGRFAGKFSATSSLSITVAGFGTDEAGIYFGYYNVGVTSEFGCLHVTGGVRPIHTLTVTTASTATDNYNVELNGTTFNVTATNNGSTVETANEIAAGTYTGWTAQAVGSTVVFLGNQAGARSGAYSLAQAGAGTPAAGSFSTTLAGVSATNTFVPQSQWNGDPLDGTGPSGVTLDPTKGNVYQIHVQYLGFGATDMFVEVNPAGNNPTFVLVHSFEFTNERTSVVYLQPSFPFTMAAYSAGSTTDVSVEISSYAGFVEGGKVLSGPRFSFDATNSSLSSTLIPLFTIKNGLTFGGRANQTVVRLVSAAAALQHNKQGYIQLVRNGTLTGVPSWTAVSAGNSSLLIDTAATGISTPTALQKVYTIPLGPTGDQLVQFVDDISLQPGETMTVAAKVVSGTGADVTACLNVREDQ